MSADLIERRAIAALRLRDAVTGAPLRRPFRLAGAGLDLLRNQSGLYVLRAAPGLADYARSFAAPPATPAVGSLRLTITVEDPLQAYLPRRLSLAAPRDPRPERAARPESLFQPVDVLLYPSPIARVEPGWALLRVSVRRLSAPEQGLAALLRVEAAAGGELLAAGMSDARGEALVAAAGVRAVMTGGAGDAVTTDTLDVLLSAYVDPTAVAADNRPPPIPDPDDLTVRRDNLRKASAQVAIASGRTVSVRLDIDVP